jgi:uncharacterized damage-inducible protein DinB
LVRKVTGIEEDAARRRLVDSGTTLLWLIKHIARAETVWIMYRFAADNGPVPDDTVQPADTLADAISAYRATWSLVDAVVCAAPTLDENCRRVDDDPPVNLRWVLMHLLEETARHAGHADILREHIDGQTGR